MTTYRLLTKKEREDTLRLREATNKDWIIDFTNNLLTRKTSRKQRLLLMKLVNKMDFINNDSYNRLGD